MFYLVITTLANPTTTSSSTTTSGITDPLNTSNTHISSSATTATNNETSSQVPPTPSITNKDSSSPASPSPPVEYIAVAIVAVILAIAGLIVMVIVIMACKRKRNSVKDKVFKGSDPDLYHSPNLKLSPLTGQVESPPSSKATTNKPVEANDDPGTSFVYCVYAHCLAAAMKLVCLHQFQVVFKLPMLL